MECPICFNTIKDSCIGTCTHHFCYECLKKWCMMGGTKCPICKTFINSIRYDKEFDNINYLSNLTNLTNLTNIDIPEKTLNNLAKLNTSKIRVNVNKDEKFNITLMNYNNSSCFSKNKLSSGVKIKNINKNSILYKNGLRKNTVILYINNIPCINHYQCVNILNSISFLGGELIIDIKKPFLRY